MENLEMNGLKVLSKNELKTIEGGKWSIAKWAGVTISAAAFGILGFVAAGPVGSIAGVAFGAGMASQYNN